MTALRKVLEVYVHACRQQGIAWEGGNYQAASECRGIKGMHLQKLKRSEKGIRALVALMDHEDVYVRLSASVHSLPYDESRAVETLRDIRETAGIPGFHAEMALKEWEKGNLKV
ncbi:hypothetical protein [Desmospora profundinema]|uniref:DUF2019 domain-containing protein n=1 Tax=Desmospora profundinema TaxID=1571184 RepID=A0ABU1IQY7_9BACL|nr:hypothetical protein [Desmospora profundinema]MDR6227203.1 hypothetical protein [Desmospora profundinema]